MTTTTTTTAAAALPKKNPVPLIVPLVGDEPAMRDWAAEVVARACTEGVELTGEDGLLTALVRQVLQTGLEVEMTDHLGYEPHVEPPGGTGNARNGSTPKTLITDNGPVPIDTPGSTTAPVGSCAIAWPRTRRTSARASPRSATT